MIVDEKLLNQFKTTDCPLEPRSGVMILLDKVEDNKVNGIIIPENKKDISFRSGTIASGIVVKLAPSLNKNREIKLYDRIIFKSGNGTRLNFQDFTFHFLEDNNILGILTDNQISIN